MKTNVSQYLGVILFLLPVGLTIISDPWIAEKHKGFKIVYTKADRKNKKEYLNLINNGIKSVNSFFQIQFKKKFDVFIHPNRLSLDSTWQKDWNIPGFKSECWMVASGVSERLDMISPKRWDKEACEHIYGETKKTQQLITHELVHVYHGQLNVSPDFSNVEGVDWFVEGLATLASGQCDSLRVAEIKKGINDNSIPTNLDEFWKGKLRYGLSGSVVMFLHKKYGLEKLRQLLPFNKKTEMLSFLRTTETELLREWKSYIQSL